MRRVACLAAGAIAAIVLAAGARQAAAMPASGSAPLFTIATPGTASDFSLFAEPSQAARAHGVVTLRVFGFEQSSVSGFSAPDSTYSRTESAPSVLELDRVFDLPSPVLGATAASSGSLVTDTVFGVVSTPSAGSDLNAMPNAFVAIASTTESRAAAQPATVSSSAAMGLKFKLLGGEHVVAFDDIAAQNTIGVVDQTSSPFFFGGPASAPATAVIGLDRTFQRLALAPNSGSLLAIGSGDAFTTPAFTTPAFAPTYSFNSGAPTSSTYAPGAQGTSVQLNFPLTLGNVDARLSLSGRELHDIRPTLIAPAPAGVTAPSAMGGRYEEFRGGVTIGVPVFKRKAEVSLNGVVDRLVNLDKSQYAYGPQQPLSLNPFMPAATNVLTQSNPTLTLDPNYVNLRRYVGAYAVAMPISKALTANMQYVDQRYGGEAVNALAQDLSVGTRSATIGVLYKIPNTNASIDLNFNQYKFLDDLTPANNFVKNRQNLFFTVKF